MSVDGGWGDFGEWSDCTKECGSGTHLRERTCENPAPQNGGRNCEGKALEIEECNTLPCPGQTSSLISVLLQCFSF